MPGLARYRHVKLGPLQKTDCLPDEDVSQALALHGEFKDQPLSEERREMSGRTSCWFRILVERSAGFAVGGSTGGGGIDQGKRFLLWEWNMPLLSFSTTVTMILSRNECVCVCVKL